MNRTKLKNYAPQARRDFIQAMADRAAYYGLTLEKIEPVIEKGDVAVIAGREHPRAIAKKRKQLEDRIKRHGFEQTMEGMAYTWFNRLVAIRFMELHGYLEHGYRVLSHPEGKPTPEILEHAEHVDLPGLKKAAVIDLKLAGNRDGELYRMLLVAQCNALSVAMPFLFERIDDDTELLLPDNLLRTDSVIAKLVQAIAEEDWAEVEIIGWLYQFYISEKKDQVIGKVVKSEDIPAATQLFTPNWIVQYLVQNSVGRLWLMANPVSTLASQWPYYIQPAEQTPEVQAQLDALIQTRMEEDGGSFNPETITVLDPACGSGHILVVAYDMLKAIYLERGYQPRTIPRLILEKNLYGLDIDDRAAQMAGFALLMKARADDRRLFNEPPKLNVLALQESKGLDAVELHRALVGRLSPQGVTRQPDPGFADIDLFHATRPQMTLGESAAPVDLLPRPLGEGRGEGSPLPAIRLLITTFTYAKTFGSLIQIAPQRNKDVRELLLIVQQALQSGDLYAQAAAQDLLPLVQQALVLGMQFDAVVTNPPYMGGKGMNPALKEYAKATFPDSKSDLFAMFMERGFGWCKPSGFNSMVTMQSWMFLSSFEALREKLLASNTLSCLAHFPYENRTPTVMGINFGISAFVLNRSRFEDYRAHFCCARSHELDEEGKLLAFPPVNDRLRFLAVSIFDRIPGKPISYWINPGLRKVFDNGTTLESEYPPKTGMTTGDDGRFLRQWFEVNSQYLDTCCESSKAAAESGRKWFPYNKGGVGNRWYGHCNFVVNWRNDGHEIKEWVVSNPSDPNTTSWSRRIFNHEFFFKPGLTWTLLNSRTFHVRFLPKGNILNVNGPTISIPEYESCCYVLGFLNSKVATALVQVINPTAANNPGDVGKLPLMFSEKEVVSRGASEAISISKSVWDESEISFDFRQFPFLYVESPNNLAIDYEKWRLKSLDNVTRVQSIEVRNNEVFIEAYGLEDELTPEVPEDQITLTRADREKDCQRLVSYAIGCMMGRYSLDEPGLIYAHAGNVGFDASRYASFPADADGIVPLTDELWFTDDAASRVREFLLAVWGADTLDENMAWLAESLGTKASETPDETIRRYLADKFFKDHLQTYKKRPIYWLFSSGKQGAFQALVYLHRYHEGTLARMRTEYVIPLQGQIAARIEQLEGDKAKATSTSHRNKLQKEQTDLKKQQAELLIFEEKLKHAADQKIRLDLDDGVKVNYGKFGDLLAEVKAITGGKDDE